MKLKGSYRVSLLVLASALLCWWVGASAWSWLCGLSVAAAAWHGVKLVRPKRARVARALKSTPPHAPSPQPLQTSARARHQSPQELDSLVEQMFSDGRYSLLLRPQIVGDLTAPQLQHAHEMLADEMALVPTGEVGLDLTDFGDFPGSEGDDEVHHAVVRVDSLYMDRYPVTNEQYQAFVDAGGYEQSSIWHPEILPAVLDFVDKSGMPGPRYWENGRYPPGKAKHPVTGVSWYEASAYARWIGKRLPSDAEWVKAASWPVAVGNSTRRQRRYPWGQAMDRERANLWSAWCGGAVSVEEFPEGVSVGGVYQLIGNVWEWTLGDFDSASDDVPPEELEQGTLKNIRGGAFDTYFENQATCQFTSGEAPLGRKHNIGFRCVLGTCDLAVDPTAAFTGQPEEALAEYEVTV
ncbi:MAG: SUMF1/EgtB/PvdO family nonheme iron enzyme [Pirellulales bacterium]